MPVNADCIVVSASFRPAITCEMLNTCAHPSRLFHVFSLKSFYMSFHKTGNHIGILSIRFHNSSPSRIPHQIRHRRKSNMHSHSRRFFCRYFCSLSGKFGLKSGSLSQWCWKNSLHPMNDIHHKKDRDMMRLFLHTFCLKFFQPLCSIYAHYGAYQVQVFFRKTNFFRWPRNNVFCFLSVKTSNQLYQLSYFFRQRHIFQNGL